MMLACGNMGPAIVAFFGMIAGASLLMGTLTSAVVAVLSQDKRAYVAVPLFSALWAFGIFQFIK